jgi:hypothetical protein
LNTDKYVSKATKLVCANLVMGIHHWTLRYDDDLRTMDYSDPKKLQP